MADNPDLTALSGTSAGITWTYVNEANRNDPEKRAYVSAMVWPLNLFFSTTHILTALLR